MHVKTAEIELFARHKKSQEKITQKFSWRDAWKDPVTGELNEIFYEGDGGEMKFFYDTKIKRMVPYMVDVYKSANQSTYSHMKKFVDNLPFEHTITNDVPNQLISFSISEKGIKEDFDETINELYQSLFGLKICEYDIRIDEVSK